MVATTDAASGIAPRPRPAPEWRTTPPVLRTARATLREVEPADARALFQFLATPAVARHLSSVPDSPESFEAFIHWARGEREAGRHMSLAVVPRGWRVGVGVMQIWSIEQGFRTAEWGFALGRRFWGEGLFAEAATALVSFAFGRLGVRRLEARAAVDNVRGNAALERLGATREGVLRRAFRCDGRDCDHALWSILAEEWSGDHAAGATADLRCDGPRSGTAGTRAAPRAPPRWWS